MTDSLANTISNFSLKQTLTGSAVTDIENTDEQDSNSNKNISISHYTKAICNSNNECIDVKISCQGNKLIGLEPVSELVKYEANWTDPRIAEVNLTGELCG